MKRRILISHLIISLDKRCAVYTAGAHIHQISMRNLVLDALQDEGATIVAAFRAAKH